MSVAVAKAHCSTETRRVPAVNELETSARRKQLGELGNERCAVARMRVTRAFPRASVCDVARARKTQSERPTGGECAEQTAGAIEMQMAQDNRVDVFVRSAALPKRAQQHMLVFDDAVAFAQLRRMTAGGDDPAVIHDDETIRLEHGRESVRNFIRRLLTTLVSML